MLVHEYIVELLNKARVKPYNHSLQYTNEGLINEALSVISECVVSNGEINLYSPLELESSTELTNELMLNDESVLATLNEAHSTNAG